MNKPQNVGADLVPMTVPWVWIYSLESHTKVFMVRTYCIDFVKKDVGTDLSDL